MVLNVKRLDEMEMKTAEKYLINKCVIKTAATNILIFLKDVNAKPDDTILINS